MDDVLMPKSHLNAIAVPETTVVSARALQQQPHPLM
jgi:hypothetical protein